MNYENYQFTTLILPVMYLVQSFLSNTHTQIKFCMRIVYSLSWRGYYCLREEGENNAYPKCFGVNKVYCNIAGNVFPNSAFSLITSRSPDIQQRNCFLPKYLTGQHCKIYDVRG